MRIIAGEFRGRRLLPPEGDDVTRPITDRVKQSVFDILAPDIEGARVLDLFAGTGSMGLEALSRGALDAIFFESSRSAVARLRKNIKTLGVKEAYVVPGDLFQYFDSEVTRTGLGSSMVNTITLVFLDPPYRYLKDKPDSLRKLGRQLAESILDEKHGQVVFRHAAGDRLELPGLATVEERTYGGMTVEFLRPAATPHEPPE